MRCDKFCECILCLELKGCEGDLRDATGASNFILAKPEGGSKKYTFFGMQADGDFEKFSTVGKEKTEKSEEKEEDTGQKHKSVIYVNDTTKTSTEDAGEEITKNEYIDEWMSLCSRENSTEINVIFKNTFSLASQIINEVQAGVLLPEEVEDDFPLGMEADLLRHYLRDR